MNGDRVSTDDTTTGPPERQPDPTPGTMPSAALSSEAPRADVESVVVSVAQAVSSQLPDLTEGMRETLGDAISELVGEQRLMALLGEAIEGNVSTVLAMLSERTPLREIQVPPAAVEHARRLAQQGVPVFAMVRAYRLGQAYLLERCFTELAGDGTDPALSLRAYNTINARTLAYIDWVSQEVVTVYEIERDQWVRNRDAVRAARVREVLADADAGHTHDAEAVLRYRLRQQHIAAVLWSEQGTGAGSLGQQEASVATIAAELTSVADPLLVSVDSTTTWAWFPRGGDDGAPDVTRLEKALRAGENHDLRVAIGSVASGVDGFRRSHQQALDVREVLRRGDRGRRRVIGYHEAGVPAAVLLTGDLERTTRMVHATLGRLAADDEPVRRLRETLLEFLVCGSSYTAAAARLSMHKNSVKYRVERALDLRDRPLADDRIDVELALIACHWLPAVCLTPAERDLRERR